MTPSSGVVRGRAHLFDLRVYWEDTDAAGIVYYANYLKFAERARSEMLRLLGIAQDEQRRTTGTVFAVKSCRAEYLAPARLDDELTVETRLAGLRHASLGLDQTIWRGEQRLVDLALRIACLGPDLKPTRLPKALRAALAQHLETSALTSSELSRSRGDTDNHGH
jgi:acyl-CoA thioester hydrolase